MVSTLFLMASSALLGQLPLPGEGAIEGVVVVAPEGQTPLAGAEVVLRVTIDGRLVPLAETITDEQGRFCFEPLPVDAGYIYSPGANRDGVHYPGRPIRLATDQPRASIRLAVRDSIGYPSPLVALEHEIIISPGPGSLSVTETILVDNPTPKCYVGRSPSEDAEPVTMRLSIPSNFERTTFHKEFFGRRFSLAGEKLVTAIPWQPGQRELKFTYVLPNTQECVSWERPLDLPTSQLRVRVEAPKSEDVYCSLQSNPVQQDGETIFQSDGKTLPQGHVLRVRIGHMPIPFMVYGRWAGLLALTGLVVVASSAVIWEKRKIKCVTKEADSSNRKRERTDSAVRNNPRAVSHTRRRKQNKQRSSR